MALISKIRKNSWLLITVIGLALAAFILMDMTSSGARSAAGDFTMGTVNGEPIDYKEFQNTEQVLYSGGGNTYSNRNYLWNFFVEKTLVNQYAEKLGVGVSKDELMELQFGTRLSPIISQRFVNQNTGQVDRASLNNMRARIEANDLDPNQRAFWAVQEKEIIAQRTQDKINTMVSKAIYAPGWMAEQRNTEQKASVDIDYVKIPYSEVDGASIEVSDEDIMNYMKAHKATFMQEEETRVAEYVSFDVVPTNDDSIQIRQRMVELKNKLENSENDSLFVINQNGVYNLTYFKEAEVTPVLRDTIFDLEVGSTYGPFLNEGQYQIIKVVDKKIIPDSVRSRHILRPVQTQEEFIAANNLLDSLVDAIESGSTTFEAAAQRFGTDATRTSGGDLGYNAQGRMVKPFNDHIFFQAEVGELRKVGTQFGLHLVEVVDKKYETNEEGVQYSLLYENIIPSQETQKAEYNRVFDLISENNDLAKLRAALPSLGKELAATGPLKENDFTFPEINTSPTAREIIRWVYTPGIKEGEISPEVFVHKDPELYYNSKLILVGLSSINEGDFPGVEAVRSRVEPLVVNKKKAESIKSELNGKDMNAAASLYNVSVEEASSVTMSSGFIPGIGNEPKVLGSAFAAEQGTVTGPIEGKEGIYYIKVTSRSDAPPISDLAASKKLYASLSKNQVGTKLWEAVRAENEVEDNRYTYY